MVPLWSPPKAGQKFLEAEILLAPKAPKQNFGCQPQTLEGEEGGGGVPPLLLRCTAVLTHRWRGGGVQLETAKNAMQKKCK